MLTRCPACATTFRVTPEQLKVRAGRVRCGQCQHAFNALDTLIEEGVPAAISATAPTAAPVAATGTLAATAEPMVPESMSGEMAFEATGLPPPSMVDGASASLPSPTQQDVPAHDIEEYAEPKTERTVAEPPPIDAGASYVDSVDRPPAPDFSVPAVDRHATIVEQPEPLTDAFLPEIDEARPMVWPWVLGVLVALLILAMQATLTFRTELAVLAPETKPLLISLCELAGCEVALPAKVELLSIETSDLHPHTERKGHLALSATLKNRAPFAQLFPHLELTLTDTANKAVARKVLKPTDYLPSDTNQVAGMPANADLAVSIDIDPTDLPASGYELYLFYP